MRLASVPLVTLLLVVCAVEIRGHGRLRVPPSRTSMWRDGFGTPANYIDNQLSCGGAWYQNGLNGGKCGVCGDPWGKPNPESEAGGKYANGIITRTYTEGQEIETAVEVTAQHGGWFEFRICRNNDFRVPVTHKCLNRHLLPLADGPVPGNSWGRDEYGRSCIGCGPQEEFYGCADVAIVPLPAS
ncbi:hypothetical protein NP493_2869g00002 [Ridgeia piscesae]|uniref:Chitin-binding type-4 domain-containing protein n=1 Tax=Ridgeia piscesae TaxID=27915 RepID=A0AAD9JBX0_RIDPI|nr:hypothetical protein NP493_2869g00002 [Ridgeia piscesae]